tara:strand:+ start:91 stop:735 length:645 start_codon:yes stop_codon:yes gene_type:complete
MNIIIPITEFEVINDPILEPSQFTSVKSLQMYYNSEDINITFVIPEDMVVGKNTKIQPYIKNAFPNSKVMIVPGIVGAPVELVLRVAGLINNDEELLITDCRHILSWKPETHNKIFESLNEYDAGIVTVNSNDSNRNYLNLETGEIVIKETVSDQALVGLHWWKSGKDFIGSASRMLQSGIRSDGQFHTSSVYNWFEGTAGYFEVSPTDVSLIK